MKKSYIITAVVLLLGLSASAQTIGIGDVAVRNHETVAFSIQLTGGGEYVASGFSVELPEGFAFTGDAIDGIESSVLKTNLKDGSTMKVAVCSEENQSFSDDTTNLLSLEVTASCEPGTYYGKISGIEFATNTLGLRKNVADVPFAIVVKNMLGDVNSDNRVTITDAVGVVNHIQGNPSTNFDKEAANVSGDIDEQGEPKITISDAVGVVNMIVIDN